MSVEGRGAEYKPVILVCAGHFSGLANFRQARQASNSDNYEPHFKILTRLQI